MTLKTVKNAVNAELKNLKHSLDKSNYVTKQIVKYAKNEIARLEYANTKIEKILESAPEKLLLSELVSLSEEMVGSNSKKLLSEISIDGPGEIVNLVSYDKVMGGTRKHLVIVRKSKETDERTIIKGRSDEARYLLDLFAKVSIARNNKEIEAYKTEINKFVEELKVFMDSFAL